MSDFQGKSSMENNWRESAPKRYKDTLKAFLRAFDIPVGSWEQTAQERSKWRGLINKGAALYEGKRIREAERKRRERKAKTNEPYVHRADSMGVKQAEAGTIELISHISTTNIQAFGHSHFRELTKFKITAGVCKTAFVIPCYDYYQNPSWLSYPIFLFSMTINIAFR